MVETWLRNDPSSKSAVNFYNLELFQQVLKDVAASHRFYKFCKSERCTESIAFLDMVKRYETQVNQAIGSLQHIQSTFLAASASYEINIASEMMCKVNSDINTGTRSLQSVLSLFSETQNYIEMMLFTDVYPRFIQHQITVSVQSSMSSGRGSYLGLGDCFCLTDPRKLDNPIVYASDGFIEVSGYLRDEIISRNCRFLQGQRTDRSAITRLKSSIKSRSETVELLLNYKKNGTPFWNLLYVAPLKDANGQVELFLGGQIDCSAGIQGQSELLRILSASADIVGDKVEDTPHEATSRGRQLLSRLRDQNHKSKWSLPAAGAEQDLQENMEINFASQVDTFYATYSTYFVLSYPSMRVEFYSRGVESIFGRDDTIRFQPRGQKIFHLLSKHSVAIPKALKVEVKASLRNGRAISTMFHFQHRESLLPRNEVHVGHFTPLKDESAVVHFIVLILTPRK